MSFLTRQALAYFESHHGIASGATLERAGVSAHAIRRLVASGSLEPVLQGAYRMTAVPFDELARCAAVCAAHPDLVVAGPTAGRLWGFRRLSRDHRIHVIAPPASHPTVARWIVPYRTTAIHPTDIVTRDDGIAVTTRARTALDLSRVLRPADARSVIEQALHDGGLDEDELRRVAVDWMTPGRPWVRRFLLQLDRRVSGGAAESHGEVVVGEALVAAGLIGVRRQHCIDLPGYGPARFDLAVPSARLAIEVDLFPTHGETAGRERDSWRDEAAGQLDWMVERLRESHLGSNLSQTARRLTDLANVRRDEIWRAQVA